MLSLAKLNKFYKEEKDRLPHDAAEIWDLAWMLAEVIEDVPGNCKLPSAWGSVDKFVAELKSKPTAIVVDIAVDALHQTLLAQSSDDYELTFRWLGEDIRAYLLSRNGGWVEREARSWAESEERKEAAMAALEDEVWQMLDEAEYA